MMPLTCTYTIAELTTMADRCEAEAERLDAEMMPVPAERARYHARHFRTSAAFRVAMIARTTERADAR